MSNERKKKLYTFTHKENFDQTEQHNIKEQNIINNFSLIKTVLINKWHRKKWKQHK